MTKKTLANALLTLMIIYSLIIKILTFRSYICNARSNGYFTIQYSKAIKDKTENIEKVISKRKLNKGSKYLNKWRPFIDHNT